ncbi:unnamed protein product [Symbiodinium sp. KB8]|nr:unnamed protein product [Symbiodinium sp. KB8]
MQDANRLLGASEREETGGAVEPAPGKQGANGLISGFSGRYQASDPETLEHHEGKFRTSKPEGGHASALPQSRKALAKLHELKACP